MNRPPNPPRLPPNQQLVKAGHWPYVGERQPGLGPDEWTLTIAGQVRTPVRFSLNQLDQLPQTTILTDIHCVTRWSKFDVEFSGVLLEHLLGEVERLPGVRYLSFVARSQRRHATSLPIDDAISLGTLIARRVDGDWLPTDHGGPIRSVVPRRYFYKSVKWLERIDLLTENQLGFWEAQAGYHDHADPWLEERYVSPDLDSRLARRLMESRDFSNQDLRSIDCSDRSLEGLRARGARLRDAKFSRCALGGADFQGANLSNANFRLAQLQGANFAGADLEGAEFAGANLTGADLRGSSFFGASFFDLENGDSVILDAATQIDPASIAQLTPLQQTRLLEGLRLASTASPQPTGVRPNQDE